MLKLVWEIIVGMILLGIVSYWGNPNNFSPMSIWEKVFILPLTFAVMVGIPGWVLLHSEEYHRRTKNDHPHH